MSEQDVAEQEQISELKPPEERFAVGIQFRRAGKVYTFVTDDASLAPHDAVMVEGESGDSLAHIARAPEVLTNRPSSEKLKHVLRRASPEDLERAAAWQERAVECAEFCCQRIEERNLPMKLIDVDIVEEGKKAIFIFFAEQRVDFRALVKDLAASLHLRIEMRQVGSRDESKMIGCMGPCGLTTCCSTHLRGFQSISISMAKNQGLAPNPAKLTGMCGKLKCCLAYEMAAYDDCRKGLPKTGSPVECPKGAGKVIGHNVLKQECIVKLYGGGETRVPCETCRILTTQERDSAVQDARRAAEAPPKVDQRKGRKEQRSKRSHGRQG